MEKITKYVPILLVIALSILTIVPLFHAGIFSMHDNTQVARVYEMAVALKDGMFPVRWVPDLGYGYGYPIFNFYAPLPYYIGGLIYLLTGAAVTSTKIMIGLGTLFAGVTMYILASRIFGRVAGVVAAVSYMYFPYHALNIYVRGAVGETFAYAFIPLVLYGVFLLGDNSKNFKDNISSILITGVALAAVIVSHNLSAFMLALMLIPVYGVALVYTKNKKGFLLASVGAFTLGAMISAFYALPAILEMGYTNVTSQVGGGADFRDHFVCAGQLWSSQWGYGGSAPGCIDGISFALGKNNVVFVLLTILLAAWYIKVKKSTKIAPIVIAFVVLTVSLFFTLPLSQFFWEKIPFIEFLQFPWRFLNFTALSISLICAAAIYILQKMKYTKIALGMSLLIVMSQIVFHADIFSAQKYDTTPDNKRLAKESLNFEISKISDEYLPKGFKKPKKAQDVPQKKFEIMKGSGEVQDVTITTNTLTTQIHSQEATTVRINSAPFPAWTLYVDGQHHNFKKREDGVYFTLDAGAHTVDYKFESTPVEKLANSITIIAFCITVLGIIAVRRK